MSLVIDQVRLLDAHIERLSEFPTAIASLAEEDETERPVADLDEALTSARFKELLRITQALSPPAASGTLLHPHQVEALLRQSGLADEQAEARQQRQSSHSPLCNQYESEAEWLVVGKAAVQTYGIILNTLLDQTIPLSDDIWYWDEVLSSYAWSSFYLVQSSAPRFLAWARSVYEEARLNLAPSPLTELADTVVNGHVEPFELENSISCDGDGSQTEDSRSTDTSPSRWDRWERFYSIVRHSIVERSIGDIQRKIKSPVVLARSEVRLKQARLRELREMYAAGLAILVADGMDLGGGDEWKKTVDRSVVLMDTVIRNVSLTDLGLSAFEDKVWAEVDHDVRMSIRGQANDQELRPPLIVQRLLVLLRQVHPHQVRVMEKMRRHAGRPSALVRYWLPAVVLIASSSTMLRLLAINRESMADWVRSFGTTVRDFWLNWVMDPIRKVISTIRHDSDSEIAIMSRSSLRADRESLERMVVDFALDNPTLAATSAVLTDAEVAEIRAKVKEGDVTPVLKAYERDMRKPFVGALMGDLVRSLLIQVQKTKVDLEVAVSGIDALLKSQELVFGFVGLTPGVLVSFAVVQYFRTLFGSRRGMRRNKRARRGIRVLRKIDKILCEAKPEENNVLAYKDHGLLLCEVHILRQLAHGLLPADIKREFIEDLDDLSKLRGIHMQAKTLERIRWAYAEWLVQMR